MQKLRLATDIPDRAFDASERASWALIGATFSPNRLMLCGDGRPSSRFECLHRGIRACQRTLLRSGWLATRAGEERICRK
jgi:hypothetical protein